MKTYLTLASVSLALAVGPGRAHAQTLAPAPQAASAQEVPTPPPTPARSAWTVPPPLAPGERFRAPAPAYDGEVVPLGEAPVPPVIPPRHCEDPQAAGRIFAEVLTASAGVTATVTMAVFAGNSDNSGATFAVTAIGTIAMYFAFIPLTVHGVARNFGGNGKPWAALLGGFVPVVGHVLGYELSHETICPEPGTPHARRAAPPLAFNGETGPHVVPTVAPAGPSGGVLGGVAFTF